jgi:photosystem II stability/assembly factor-like uncharacterized protein
LTQKGRVWIPIGPSPITESHDGIVLHFNGLVSSIAINPSNPNIIYMGTGGGGVWRSIDGGLNWIPIFDRQLSLGVGGPCGIAIDPINTNIVYVGISSRVNKEPRSGGLFKSVDGGYSWIRLGSDYPFGNSGNADQFFENNIKINVTIVDPVNSNTLYLATDRGVFRSTDGGLNWTRGSTPTGILSGDARSLVLDTSVTGSRILYSGISGNGVFRSNDGGLNWTRILDQTTPAVQAAAGPAGFSKVLVDIPPPISPPNPAGVQIIYVSLESLVSDKNDPVGIFISRDQGATWSQQDGIDLPKNCQGGYSFHMAVDPSSPGDGTNDIIYIGCVGQRRSDDSGNNFTKIFSGVHADTHAWAFVRQPSPTPSIVYNGNDGGLAKSTDRGTTWTLLSSGGLQTGLFYNIDARPDPPGHVTVHVGALQDNGLYTTDTGSGLEWNRTKAGGDGGDIKYDGIIPRQVYGSNWGNGGISTRVWLSKDDGLNFPDEITPWDDTFFKGGYLAPIATDPSTGGIVYVSGFQEQWQSFDSGEHWRIISRSGLANDMDVSRINGNFVVFSSGGKVFLSTNALASTVGPPAGVTFTDITQNLLQTARNVLRVAFDPNDPSTIYAVLGGFSGFPGGHVFRTNIGASIWTDISPEFDVPFSALALDGTSTPSTIYVGTEFGVLRSIDGGSSWSVLDEIHFPLVPVVDLKIRNGLLRAATYGRGTFVFGSHSGGPVIAVNIEHNLKFGTIHQGPNYLTLQVFNVGLPGSNVEDLIIENVQRLMGSTSFSVLSTPSTPLAVRAGEHIDFTIEYNPKGAGVEEIATIRITSNDPTAPTVDLSTSGMQEAYD